MSVLGTHSVEEFLNTYWQKKPLVIRNAIPDLEPPIEVDELAGLACEPNIESRLVFEEENGHPWQLHNGPFDEGKLQSLPNSHWTLLVQGLDYWIPEAADLLDAFRFIPNWRLDDIMASFAPQGGSVGPHFDQYDVFLLQTHGHRRWKIGHVHDNSSPRVEGTPLHILADFETVEEYVLEPGDMLYLPPGVSHWGIAEDDCMTLSIGFRTPSHAEVVTGVAEYISDNPGLGHHLEDPSPRNPDNPGRIDDHMISELQRIVKENVNNEEAIASWFGQAMTEPKHDGVIQPPEEPVTAASLQQAVGDGEDLLWNEGSRFSFYDGRDGDGKVRLLFADGQRFRLRGDAIGIAELICAGRHIPATELAPWLEDEALLELLVTLCNQGSLYVSDNTEEAE